MLIKGETTSKQRVLATMQFEKADRIPMNYMANEIIHNKLAHHLGVSPKGTEVEEALSIDFRGIPLPYTGKPLHHDIAEVRVDKLWGSHTRLVKNQTGEYWDYCDFPLKDATMAQIADWPMPDADDFDYDHALEWCKKNKDFALVYGNPGLFDILNTTGTFFTVEEELMRIFDNDETVRLFNDRRLRIQMNIAERILSKCSEYLDLMWMGEDLGTQHTPLIGIKTYRQFIRPRHQMLVDLANAYNIPVMIHSCGSSSWAFNDFIEMGIRGVDTLQPEAHEMSPQFLADNFGDKLFFHGCISTAGPLAYGSVDDIKQNVKNTLDIMMKHKGYCLAPTHLIQDNTPVENIVCMYQSALEFGRY